MAISMEDVSNNQRRQMPVILILDTSGSMSDEGNGNGGITQLNRSIRGMLSDFKHLRAASVEFCFAVITFGGDSAQIYQDYTPLETFAKNWKDMSANGMTPLGDALDKAKQIIEDKTKLLPRSYRPTVILISDGYPTDAWENSMENFTKDGRTAKSDRFVVTVAGAATNVLQKFVDNPKTHMFNAENASDILEFMRFMSSSIAKSSTSNNPNKKESIESLQKAVAEQETINEDWGEDISLDDIMNEDI